MTVSLCKKTAIPQKAIFILPALFALLITACLWEDTESISTENGEEYLALDDSEYPYAELPRMVIETKDFAEIRERDIEFPAKLQIYGKDEPISPVMKLTVRGRGNSSFKMPKYGIKLEFAEKQAMFGMPENKDWILVANYGDKTHLRNHMAFRLSEWLGASYTPKDQFVELYLNRKYMGLYLFTESIKVGKNRVNIPKNENSFLFEKEDSKKLDSPSVTTKNNKSFHVKYPKNPSQETLDLLEEHLNNFEDYLGINGFHGRDNIETWLDLENYFIQYWIQEFSKNEDGRFARSIYMSWQKNNVIHFGPIWDMDLAFGNQSYEKNRSPDGWYIKSYSWNHYILADRSVNMQAKEFWNQHREHFKNLIDSIPVYVKEIEPAIKNEYKRWPIISNTENWALKKPYGSYEEAVEDMVQWMQKRYQWIEENL